MEENNTPKIELVNETESIVDGKQFILKIPYTQTDEFGTVGTFYRKEYISLEQLNAQIDAEDARHQLIMDELLAKKDAITEN